MTKNQKKLSHLKYRSDIDGLRAIAVLAVVSFHAFPNWLKGGFIGVDVFFVISGYLISTIIFKSLDKGTFSFYDFYARRIKRVFPALILVLVTFLIFGWFTLLANEYKQLGKHILAGAGFVSNIVFWREASYFDNAADTKPFLHLWSLGVEEQFYIVWPLILWFVLKRKLNLVTTTVIFAITSFVLNLKGIKQDSVATFYSLQTRFWELLTGSLLAWVELYKNNQYAHLRKKLGSYISNIVHLEKQEVGDKLLSNALSFFGFTLLAYGFLQLNKGLSFPGKWALIPVIGTLLLLISGSKAWVNRTILSNKIAVWIGLISFPLYLWHWPLLSFARIIYDGEVSGRIISVIVVILSIVLAWLTYKHVECPLRFGKHSKAKVITLCVLMVVIGCIGQYIYSHDGLKFRLINKLNNGVNEALSYDWSKGFRHTECFIDDTDEKSSKFSRICGEPSKNIRSILIWGDSHAASLYRGFDFQARSRNFSLYQFTASGCPPILNFYIENIQGCINSNKYVYEELKILKPDIVIMAASWASYDVKYGLETLYYDKLIETIDKLKLLGIKNIIILGPLPMYKVNQANLLIKRSSSNKIPNRTYSKFKPIINTYDEKIKNIASLTGVSFISPLDILCDFNGCLLSLPWGGASNIQPFSFDDSHLTSTGSIFLVSKFFELNLIKFTK